LDAWGLLDFKKVVLLDVLPEFLIDFFTIEFFEERFFVQVLIV
jgi:hypothetical protein